jgi:hypothetical protein
MYTQEKDPMIIPFDPDDDGDNRASAIMAALLVVFGSILMAVSLWAFLPNSTSTRDQIVAPIHRELPWNSRPGLGKPQ